MLSWKVRPVQALWCTLARLLSQCMDVPPARENSMDCKQQWELTLEGVWLFGSNLLYRWFSTCIANKVGGGRNWSVIGLLWANQGGNGIYEWVTVHSLIPKEIYRKHGLAGEVAGKNLQHSKTRAQQSMQQRKKHRSLTASGAGRQSQ